MVIDANSELDGFGRARDKREHDTLRLISHAKMRDGVKFY
jgi:hypothetical protein